LDFVTNGILSRIVKESGGPDAKIVIIPTASSIPVEVGQNYISAFKELNCSNLTVLDMRKREDAENKENIKHIVEADCIMFSGGDQSKIVDIIGQTTIHKILKERFEKERIVIAGTSAGAMAMSAEMISGGSSTEALNKGSVQMRKGMNFIPGLIIDTHFIQRGRFGRVSEAVARFPNLLGVGLAENTGMVVENCNKFTVIGSGMVIVFDPSNLTHNNVKILPEGTPMTMANLIVHVLANGDSFYIDERKLTVLPMLEAFKDL
jgi:cyanophycinase